MDNSEPAALMEETLSEEADRIDIAHALLRNKVHCFSEDDLHRFSDDGASGSTDTTADPIANGTAKSDDPKAPHDGAAAQDAAPAPVEAAPAEAPAAPPPAPAMTDYIPPRVIAAVIPGDGYSRHSEE